LVKNVFSNEVEHIHNLEIEHFESREGLVQIAANYRNGLYKMGKYEISDYYKKLKN